MKQIITITALLSSLLFSQYLQDGIYPECSYVIVDQEGWKIHKNQDGKTISMTPKSKHNEKPGKYSFDKFGNLVPFKECVKDNNTTTNTDNTDIELDIEVEFNLFKMFSGMKVYGGMSMPMGTSADLYESGLNFGGSLDIGILTGEVNMATFTAKDGITDLKAAYGMGYLNKKISDKIKISVGGGLSKLNNGTGISAISAIALSYELPLNLGIKTQYNKYIGISKDDGSIEFDYELLDSFNINLYYSF